MTAAAGYLTKDVRKRQNLAIETEAFVTRVLLDGTKAVGVEYMGKDGETHTVNLSGSSGEVTCARLARRESVNMQLDLMLSYYHFSLYHTTGSVDRWCHPKPPSAHA